MEETLKRQTAYKIWISDLINHEFIHRQGEWESNYVQIGDKKVSRVNLIATVIDKRVSEDGSYSSLIIDDGSESIIIKAWRDDSKLISNINIGQSILIIGRVREYNNKVYISPEIVKHLDKKEWVELRKKELIKEYGIPNAPENNNDLSSMQEQIKEDFEISEESIIEETTETNREKILANIEKLNSEDGADTEQVISMSGMEENLARSVLQQLLKDGEIFEISPGKVKMIE